jgi:hypothetical protein
MIEGLAFIGGGFLALLGVILVIACVNWVSETWSRIKNYREASELSKDLLSKNQIISDLREGQDAYEREVNNLKQELYDLKRQTQTPYRGVKPPTPEDEMSEEDFLRSV